MTAIPDHYAALGIDPTADPEVIAAAYRALAKKYHPDTGATTGTASAERFEQVQQAYEVLRSPESRRQYDLELLAQTERDLAAHLARKRRALPGAADAAPGLPNPDLGAIRPEPSAGRLGRGAATPPQSAARRSTATFLIPALLLLVLAGAAALLFLPGEPGTPGLATAENTPMPAENPAPSPAASSTPASSDPAAPAGGPQEPAPKQDADVAVAPSSTPGPAATAPEGEAQEPVFGASEPEEAGAATAEAPVAAPVLPAPTPKPRPAKQAAAAAKPPAAPRQQAEAAGAYTLTIYERRRRGRIVTRQADMLFASRGSCVEFGVKAVLRRMEARNMNPRRQRVWYECEPAF